MINDSSNNTQYPYIIQSELDEIEQNVKDSQEKVEYRTLKARRRLIGYVKKL